uniref:Uncharacterized protein n=1 Tax=Lotharella oceanica TaxID=641309 RepID=A0A7S2XIE8_9EUKA
MSTVHTYRYRYLCTRVYMRVLGRSASAPLNGNMYIYTCPCTASCTHTHGSIISHMHAMKHNGNMHGNMNYMQYTYMSSKMMTVRRSNMMGGTYDTAAADVRVAASMMNK